MILQYIVFVTTVFVAKYFLITAVAKISTNDIEKHLMLLLAHLKSDLRYWLTFGR